MTTASGPALDDLAGLAAVLSKFQGRRILCLGDVMVDRSIYGEVKRISPEAPVPVVRITRETSELGGAGKGFEGKPRIGVHAVATLNPQDYGLPPFFTDPIQIQIDTEFEKHP